MKELTAEEVRASNEKIARFMGYVLDTVNHEEGTDHEWMNMPKGTNWCFDSPPPFHDSWQYLMPVIQKLLIDMSNKNWSSRGNEEWANAKRGIIERAVLDHIYNRVTIEYLFSVIIYVIDWYNQQNEQK